LVVYAANPATLKLLPSTVAGAACLDGSPPGYYFAPGQGTGVNKWFIYHQGGGWCSSLENCYERSQGNLGSSKKWPASQDLGDGYFSPSHKINPVMFNWNKVYLPYCDGGSFSGNNRTVAQVNGHSVYFRGYLNLQSVYLDLVQTRNLKAAKEVVISGCSAGGLAAYLHLDWWAAGIPGAVTKGMPDSGFFLDYDSPAGPKYGKLMRWVFDAMNCSSGVNQACIAGNKGMEANCMFAEHTGPHLAHSMFPLQSEYDSWQIDNILGTKVRSEINKFGQTLVNRFVNSILKHPKSGVFLDSCYHHCGEWDSIIIDGANSGAAFEKWYRTGRGTFTQGKPYPCDACCKPHLSL